MSIPADAPIPAWQLDTQQWPAAQASRHQAVLVHDAQGQAWLLAARPLDILLLQVLEARLSRPVQWQQLAPAAFQQLLEQAETSARAVDGMDPPATAEAGSAPWPGPQAEALHELSLAGLEQAASPAVQLLDALLLDALKDGVSDLHFERRPRGSLVRARVDGVMQPRREVDDSTLAEAMVSRLKVLAELDIGERRVPQDGRFRLRVRGRAVDFRLSVLPTVHGEDAVVRVLDRGALQAAAPQISLAALGYPPALALALQAQARVPHGLLLATGPTGSGKTTTLYALLSQVDQQREKLVTIEDPVEYALHGATQMQVNERQGLGFARGLRSILRHDPDRVMVGEIRDAETAQIAVQAALTGHLVFSTVHANHALDVFGRFAHMGIEPYNLVTALNAVLGQRLLRKVCAACAGQRPSTPAERVVWGLQTPQARGCPACAGTGYRGRLAVAELLRLDDDLRELLLARAPAAQLREAAQARGMRSLVTAAQDAVRNGHTTIEEVHRVFGSDE
jgi:general secretion pathway protein E